MIHYIHTHTHDTLNTYTHTLFTTHIIHMIHYTHTRKHTLTFAYTFAHTKHTHSHTVLAMRAHT